MVNVFYNFLNPVGSSYAPRMKVYKALKEMDANQIKEYLEGNFTHNQLMNILVEYLCEELTQDKEVMPRIRITQEQFDAYFRVIKPHKKGDNENIIKDEIEG